MHLEEEEGDNGKDPESDDPCGIEGVTEEFMVWLVMVVKDAQAEEKLCYHCSSPEHFICNYPLMKTARDKKQLNGKEGMASIREPGPLWQQQVPWRAHRRRLLRHTTHPADSLLESGPFPPMVWNQKCGQSEDKWRKLHGPLGQWCTGKYHHAKVHKWPFTAGRTNYIPHGFKSHL